MPTRLGIRHQSQRTQTTMHVHKVKKAFDARTYMQHHVSSQTAFAQSDKKKGKVKLKSSGFGKFRRASTKLRIARRLIKIMGGGGIPDEIDFDRPQLVGMSQCNSLRAMSALPAPGEEKIAEALENGDHIFIDVDEKGGAYVSRKMRFPVAAFMRLRCVEAKSRAARFLRQDHEGSDYESESSDDEGAGKRKGRKLFVKRRMLSESQSYGGLAAENWKKTKVFKFVKNEEDRGRLKNLFQAPAMYDNIRTLFRQYSYSRDGDAFTLSMGEWLDLCKDSGVLKRRGMSVGKAQTIFIASNYKGKEEKDKGKNPDNAMTLYEFLEGLCRLAMVAFASSKYKTADERVQALMNEHIHPLADHALEKWTILDDIESEAVQEVYATHLDALKSLFYSHCAKKHQDIHKMALSIAEFESLIEHAGLLDEKDVTRRTVREVFVWSQRRNAGAEKSVRREEQSLEEMEFFEFLESVALLAIRKYQQDEEASSSTS